MGQKRDKIKRNISIRHIKEGGIGIPDINAYIKSLKIKWIQRLEKYPSPIWKHVLTNFNPRIASYKLFGTKKWKILLLTRFGRMFFKAYDYADSKVRILTTEELLTEPLFFNTKFIKNKENNIFSRLV